MTHYWKLKPRGTFINAKYVLGEKGQLPAPT